MPTDSPSCRASRSSSPRFPKVPRRSRGVPLSDTKRPHLLATKQFRLVKHKVSGCQCLVILFKVSSENVRVRSSTLRGSRGPLLRPRRKTQLSVVIGVRSATLFGQNGPGTAEGCTFSKMLVSTCFSKIHDTVAFSVPLGLLGLSGPPLGGPRGPTNQPKVPATLKP